MTPLKHVPVQAQIRLLASSAASPRAAIRNSNSSFLPQMPVINNLTKRPSWLAAPSDWPRSHLKWIQRLVNVPSRIVGLHLAEVAVAADVIANPVLVGRGQL